MPYVKSGYMQLLPKNPISSDENPEKHWKPQI